MKNLKSKFIVLDGPDGCGKTTQVELLSEWITGQDVEVVSFRDPGTTAIGEKIRRILLDVSNKGMSDRTELSLYMAARAQLWAECIGPALAESKCVVLDRWLSSTCAYQGYAGGVGIEKVIDIAQHSLERTWPEVTIILDVDLKTSSKRLAGELDRMESKPDEYHQKVRQGFIEFARIADNTKIIDAGQDIQTVHKNVIEIVKELCR